MNTKTKKWKFLYNQEIKKGRKVVFIKFIIYQANENKSLPLDTTTKDELSERLQKYFCLFPVQTEKVLNTYEEKYIVENLAFIEGKHKKGEIQNIGAYTIKALKEDYRNQKSQFDIQKEEKEKEKKQKQIKQQEKRKLVEKLKKQFDEQKQDKIKKIQQDLKNQGKLPLEIQEFEEIEIGEIFVERWEKEGLKNTMFQLMFDNFLAKRHLNPDESDFITWAEKQGHNIKKDLKGEYILITN